MGNLSCPIIACPLWKKHGSKNSTEFAKIHRFPRSNISLRETWESFVSEVNGIPYKSSKYDGLCSSHFKAKYVMPSGRVSRDAVPSIAPMTTKKLLCKWDSTTSRLFPVRVLEDTREDSGNSIETQGNCSITSDKEEECVVNQDIMSNVSNSDNITEVLMEDYLNSPLKESVSVPDLVKEAPTAASPVKEPCSASSFVEEFRTFFNIMKDWDGCSLPEKPESLNTVKNVEIAIEREKKLAVMQYKESVRKVQDLEAVLKRLKTTKCHCSQLKNIASPEFINKPNSEVVKDSSLQPVWKVAGGHDLPPPLFDDYN